MVLLVEIEMGGQFQCGLAVACGGGLFEMLQFVGGDGGEATDGWVGVWQGHRVFTLSMDTEAEADED